MSESTEYRVTGMTCGHCVAAVTDEVGAIAGVTGVDVDLRPEGTSTVTVTSAAGIPRDRIVDAVREAGYELVE